MEFKLKSVRTIIYKVLRDFGIGDREVDWQSMIEWSAEALQLIDAYTQYIERFNYEIEVENNLAKLPMDYYAPLTNPNLVYKIQGDSILTEKKNGKIKFNYLAFPLDDEGFLMIPDNVSYDEALKWRIGMMLAIRGDLVSTTIDLKYCETKWNFYCKQARSKSSQMSVDSMEKFARNRLRFVPDYNQYSYNFNRVQNKLNK